MSNIASLDTLSNALDTTAKFIRVVEKAGVTLDQLMHPVNSRTARRNLAAFLKAGCPEMEVRENLSYLRRLGDIALPERVGPLDPAEYFKSRAGLWVSAEFRDRILAVASPAASAPTTFASYELVKRSNDDEIRRELPEGHVFEDVSAFCAHLAGLISRQPGGKEGDLIANGYANIFYVRGINSEVFAVSVYWNAGHREWRVHARRLDDYRRDVGRRVLSSNC